jgi:hypothetical protein
MEEAADPEHLRIIRELFGSRAQTLINSLLTFDAFLGPGLVLSLQGERALAGRAGDARGAGTRQHAARHRHGRDAGARFGLQAQLLHAARRHLQTTADILSVGNVWAFDLLPLEMHNAEAKRTGAASGSRRTTLSTSGQAQVKPSRNSGEEGPAQLVQTKGNSTTQSLSILNNLLVSKVLRQGDGMAD